MARLRGWPTSGVGRWYGERGETFRISRLRAFSAAAGLAFVEFIITTDETPRVVDVDIRPRFELFGEAAQWAIAEALADELKRRSGDPEWPEVV